MAPRKTVRQIIDNKPPLSRSMGGAQRPRKAGTAAAKPKAQNPSLNPVRDPMRKPVDNMSMDQISKRIMNRGGVAKAPPFPHDKRGSAAASPFPHDKKGMVGFKTKDTTPPSAAGVRGRLSSGNRAPAPPLPNGFRAFPSSVPHTRFGVGTGNGLMAGEQFADPRRSRQTTRKFFGV